MLFRIFISLVASTLAVHELSAQAFPESKIEAKREEGMKKLIDGENDFGFSLYATLKSPNVLFSPYSIHTCMSMAYIGARSNTAVEIKKALKIPLNQAVLPKIESRFFQALQPPKDAKSYQLNIANAMWLDRDTFVLADYRHSIEDDFKAKLQTLDFSKTEEAISIINEWTSNQTQGKIPQLLQGGDVDANTRLVLTNAVYFKGSWQKPFVVENTNEAPFFSTSEKPITVKMMEQTSSFPYFENDSIQLLSLPFTGKNENGTKMACLLLLPKDPANLASIEKDLSSSLQTYISSLNDESIHVKIPSFELKQRLDLNQALAMLGVKDAFSPQADFSGIDGLRDLYLSKVVHEAFFSLDEAGVTAAAATAAAINMLAVLPTYTFTADHPFLFFLVDMQTKTLLFMGKLSEPMASHATSTP